MLQTRGCDFHRVLPPEIPGAVPVGISEKGIEGIWKIRFGLFGWPDRDLRGGVLRITERSLFGGSSHFLFRGHCNFDIDEIRGYLKVDRHASDPTFVSIYGTSESNFRVDFVAHAISRDHLDGYFHRLGYPDGRVVFRRFIEREPEPVPRP
jgi:hypothetical protein